MIELAQANAVRIPLADESVHCVVTSPPYFGPRDYSLLPLVWGGREDCQHEWVSNTRLNVGGGHNPGPQAKVYATKSGNQRFEIEESFCLKCGAWRGSLGLEPNIDLYIQHLVQIFREVRRVLRKDGQLFLNISDTRTKDRQWHGVPHKLMFALQDDGWRWEDEIIWKKPNSMPSSQTNRFTRSHEFVFMLNKSRDAFFDMDAVREPLADTTQVRRIREKDNFGKVAPQRRKRSNPDVAQAKDACYSPYEGINPAGRSRRSVWTISTKGYKGAHFAVFPEALVGPCIRAGTSERGCCPECGKAWVRVTERANPTRTMGDPRLFKSSPVPGDPREVSTGQTGTMESITTGWRPACDCWKAACDERGMTYDEGYEHFNHLPEWLPELAPIPCTALDPFCGSGTTLLAARKLGRSAVGLDLSYTYLHDQARTRLKLDKLAEWESGREPVQANWDGLPLWAAAVESD